MTILANETPDNRKGFVLVAVIWLAGLIAAVATGFALTTRIEIQAAANATQNAKAEAIADGLARLTALRLAGEPAQAQVGENDPRAAVCRWSATETAGIAIQDQSGLIDLNAAPTDLIARLMKGLGAPDAEATRLSAALADYRDAGNDAEAGGFEPETYPSMPFGPKNGPFLAVEELDQLPGMTQSLYRALLPLVTVQSLQPGFDPNVAPPALKSALGFTAANSAPPDLVGLTTVTNARAFGIDVFVEMKGGARYHRRAVIEMVRQPGRPFAVLSWQRGGDFAPLAKPARDCLN
jgi:general secretion pathway protein K